MTRILVTGATGFIGQHLIKALASDDEVFCVVRPGRGHLAATNVKVVDADLAAPGFRHALPKTIDSVIHLAVAPPSLNPAPLDMFSVNVMATLELLEYAKESGAEGFVLASSGSVYAASATLLKETADLSNDSLLAISKITAESLLHKYSSFFAGVALRLFYVYGAQQPSNLLMARLAANIQSGQPIKVGETGGPRISATHVDDAVQVIRATSGLSQSAVLNVAHPEPTSIGEVASLLGEILGKEPNFVRTTDGCVRDLTADVSALRDRLGWAPSTPLAEGLAHAYAAGV